MNTTASSDRRMRVALIATYMLFAVLLNSVGTVILQSMASFHIAKVQASLLEAFKDLSIAGASFVLGSLVLRLGYRRSMIASLALVALGAVLMPLFPAFRTTELLFALVGIAFAATKISVYSAIGLLTHGRGEHASLTNIIEGMFMVGMLSGYWIFSGFIDAADPANLRWLNVYWLLAALSVAVMLLLMFSRLDESTVRAEAAKPMRESMLTMLRLAVRRLVYLFLIAAFLYVLVEQSIGTWLPTFNREVLKLPNAMSVQVASILAATLAVGRLSAGVILRRIGWYPLLNVCLLAMALLIILTLPMARDVHTAPQVTWFNAPAAAYLVPLIGLFMAPIYPAINSVVLSGLPKAVHAPMTGLIVVFSALGGTLGSRLTAIVFSEVGGERAFYFSLVPIAAIALTLWFFRREVERNPLM